MLLESQAQLRYTFVRSDRCVHARLFELPDWSLPFIQDVQLGWSPILRFWQQEEGANEADEGGAGEEESDLTSPIGRIWIEHVWEDEGHDPCREHEDDPSNALCTCSQVQGRDLGCNREDNRAYRHLVYETLW